MHNLTVKKRFGLTLVELLVVVVILVLLIGVALPLAQPALNGRDVREAARQVNAAFAAAKVNAAATGQPTAVIFTPDASGQRCYNVSFGRVPPPNTGESDTWKAGFAPTVDLTDLDGNGSPYVLDLDNDFDGVFDLAASGELQTLTELFRDFFFNSPENDRYVAKLAFTEVGVVGATPRPGTALANPVVLNRLLEIGWSGPDTDPVATPFEVKFDFRGEPLKGLYVNFPASDDFDGFYVGIRLPRLQLGYSTNQLNRELGAQFSEMQLVDVGNNEVKPAGRSFQLMRRPKKSTASPIDLPIGTYIDLSVSGMNGSNASLANGVTAISFHPNGTLHRVYTPSMVSDVRQPVFFLVAKGKDPGGKNLQRNAGSLWAIADAQTGNVRTTENLIPTVAGESQADIEDILNLYPPPPGTSLTDDQLDYLENVINRARQFAVSGPDKGGR